MTGVGGGSPQPATLAWPRPDDQAVFALKLLWRRLDGACPGGVHTQARIGSGGDKRGEV